MLSLLNRVAACHIRQGLWTADRRIAHGTGPVDKCWKRKMNVQSASNLQFRFYFMRIIFFTEKKLCSCPERAIALRR